MRRECAADDLKKKIPSTEVNHAAAITENTFHFFSTKQRYEPLGSKPKAFASLLLVGVGNSLLPHKSSGRSCPHGKEEEEEKWLTPPGLLAGRWVLRCQCPVGCPSLWSSTRGRLWQVLVLVTSRVSTPALGLSTSSPAPQL